MIDKTYNHALIEPKWVDGWLTARLFHAQEGSKKQPYSIVIPPPNVTGSLHLGHALNNTLQDILCRYKRMTGYEVLWMPGTDHAGIATQNVVERKLQAQGKNKHDLGRDEFVKRVWEWKAESGGQIISQLKRLGCSCDWDRERFTMDEGLSATVREVFVRLYTEGLIYRGDYMINWCPRCESALADLEVEYPDEPEEGMLYRLRYPLRAAVNGISEIIVDTTRPETMLGDTAVAVHPDDQRFTQLIGKEVILPIVGRVIPIIADSFVDPSFGSGAVKVTPGHDPNDFEAGRRHALEIISVIGPDGKMTKQAGEYAGLDRFACRTRILADLTSRGFLIESKKHQLKTGRCYRCQTVTEPLVSTQWFMRMKEMAKNAIEAVEDGRTRVVPESWQVTYFQWLENIRDWCISRQLWWGHQIPVWYCDCGQIVCAQATPKACPTCKSTRLVQDQDVLDTWFSSALWPFSTMGWPEETGLYKKFYPTSVLVTGFDILFFWVARMMMLGLKLTKTVPFSDIYLHAMVRDEHGQKMSKTKGNVIDPLELIAQYGADAVRFTLAILTLQGRDVALSPARIEGYRNFINKIWNGARFILLQLESEDTRKINIEVQGKKSLGQGFSERWIRSRLAAAIVTNESAYREYQFSELSTANYRFFWDEFCSWYLEIAKLQLKQASPQEKREIIANLIVVLEASLRLLHPVIPFVTEEINQALPKINGREREALVKTPFPSVKDYGEAFVVDSVVETEMSFVQAVVNAVRTMRAEKNLPPAFQVTLYVEGEEHEVDRLLQHVVLLQGLARLSEIVKGPKPERSVSAVVGGVQVHLSLQEGFDTEKERIRIERELAEIHDELKRSEAKLENPDFIEKAPSQVVEKERSKIKALSEKRAILQLSLREL